MRKFIILLLISFSSCSSSNESECSCLARLNNPNTSNEIIDHAIKINCDTKTPLEGQVPDGLEFVKCVDD